VPDLWWFWSTAARTMTAFLLGLFIGAFFATLVMLITLYYRRV
jgi:hypothetical protein